MDVDATIKEWRVQAIRYANRLNSKLDRLELESAAMYTLWRCAISWDKRMPFRAYLRFCLRRQVRNMQYRQYRNKFAVQRASKRLMPSHCEIPWTPPRKMITFVDMSILPPRQQDILRRIYWDDEGLREIGGSLGLTHQRIAQLRDKGLRKLKELYANNQLQVS